jgi:predicted kinase
VTTVHLICGFLGAGKTTFAKSLATRESAIRISIDELYLRLFADGPTYDLDRTALERLRGVLNDIWPEIVRTGVSVVLDCGFWSRSVRDEVREQANSAGVIARLYWLCCPDEVAMARCLKRNGQPDSFLISAEGFVGLKQRFEPPDPDELYEIIDSA